MERGGLFERLDADQRAAVALRRNGTVSAGAGSGKTTVLAARYLDLVLHEGIELGSVLCLTFTRKAAAEMRSRVYRELAQAPGERARAQLDRFSEAAISTIDSFCGAVLRSSAQDYGYAPDFSLDDEAARELAESGALRFLLARREEPVLRELFARMGFETAWRGLFAEAAYRFGWPCLRPEGNFRSMPARARASLERGLRDALGAVEEAKRLAQDAGAARTQAAQGALAIFRDLPEALSELPREEAARALAPLAARKLTGFGRDDTEALIKEATEAGRKAAGRFRSLAETERLLPLQTEILGLLADFAEEYRDAKRRAGIMGFRDAAVAAVDLLGRRPELRAFWKRRYRYLMVDEFQDDDELQKELLYLLAEREDREVPGLPGPGELAPDKLFFVGDDKQSIYRFRGADVSVFNRLGRELSGTGAAEGNAAPMPRLRTNYRSEPALLAFFNELFSRVLAASSVAANSVTTSSTAAGSAASPGAAPPGADSSNAAVADYEARFEEALGRAPSPGLCPSVRLFWKPRSIPGEPGEYRSADEALAEGLARLLKREIETGALLVPGPGAPRRATYDDCAVLFRSTTKQYLLERFFRLHGIPYSAGSQRGLLVESPANDLYAALRLALLPDDRLAYATLLRSPLVGLSDDGFVLTLDASGEAFDPAAEALLDRDDLERFRRGARLFEELRQAADRRSIAELVSWLWYEGGLRLSLLRRPDSHAYLEHYDYLFSLAAQADAAGENLAGFVARLEPLMGKPEKLDDLEVQREAARGVRIMTVHASKGLEFPVVILPWIEGTGRQDGAGEAFYLSEEAGLSLNLRAYDEPGASRANAFYDEAKELEGAKELAEVKRLFYVACTRASAHLVFAAVEPRAADNKGRSFLSLLAGGGGKPGPDGDFAALPAAIRVAELQDLAEREYRALARRRPAAAFAVRAPEYESAAILDRGFPRRILPATALAQLAWETDPRRGLPARLLPATAYDEQADSIKESLFGELCHATLEAALRHRPLRLPSVLLAEIPEELRGGLIREAERLARNFLDTELGRRISRAPRLDLEKTLLLPLGPYLIRCRLDLYAEDEAGILVLDWKSGREARSEEYEIQLALYRRAARALEPERPISSALVWLRSGEAKESCLEPGEEELLRLARLAAEAAPREEGGETP